MISGLWRWGGMPPEPNNPSEVTNGTFLLLLVLFCPPLPRPHLSPGRRVRFEGKAYSLALGPSKYDRLVEDRHTGNPT